MSIARPPTYRARKPKGPVASFDDPKKTYRPPKSAPGVTDLATAVASANAHGNATAAPSYPSYDTGDTQPQYPVPGVAAPATAPPPFGTPPAPTDPGATPATPSPSNVPPPESAEGAADRTTARTNYGVGQSDINRRILQAAMDYGGVPTVEQSTYDAPTDTDSFTQADVASNPNSQISQIARALTDNSRSLSEDLNNRGSYFSGAHLENQTKLDDQSGRDRLAAQTAFDRALGDLVTQLAIARGTREGQLGDANLADINAANSVAPTAQDPNPNPAVDATAPPGAGATTPPPAAGGPQPLPGEPVITGMTNQKTTSTPGSPKTKTKKVKRATLKVVK